MRKAPPRWSSNLLGVTFSQWLRLLWQNGFQIDFPYLRRAVAVTTASLANSLGGAIDAARTTRRPPAPAMAGPIFILGHWRSGTTWLHTLMSRDPAFAAPNFYDVMFPSAFISFAALLRRLVPDLLPASRLFDNMSADPDLPQEDEFALASLTGCSPYLAYTFPRRWDFYDRFLTLDDVDAAELTRWKHAFAAYVHRLRGFYKKPIILKSPPHTARVRRILEMFPDARFIHIHRNPYEVFQSTRRMLSMGPPFMQMQKFDFTAVDQIILQRYAAMHEAFLEQRGNIAEGRLCEISFESMRSNPLAMIHQIYETLQLSQLGGNAKALAPHLASPAPYTQNAYPPLPLALKHQIQSHWARFFSAWGYRL